MIRNQRFGTGLKEYLPYVKIIDQSKTSDQYFRLFDVPDKLYVGKNSFRIRANKNTLVQGSLLYIDIVDSTGEIIYHEITDLVGEDGSRLIVAHIYEDTPPGEATIYIGGRASYDVKNQRELSYSKDPATTTEYIDYPNIIWRGKVVVVPTMETDNEIIFARPPKIKIRERFEEYNSYQSAPDRLMKISGPFNVSISPVITAYDYSDTSKSGIRISENSLNIILDPEISKVDNTAESKQISIDRYSEVATLHDSAGNFTEDYRGGEIVIRDLTSQLNVPGITVPDFSCSIIEVIDIHNVKIWPAFSHVYGEPKENVFNYIKNATNVTASYYTTQLSKNTIDSESFVQLEFENLEPLAGKIDSVAISYKPYGTFGEFIPMGEFRITPQDYLIDSSSLVLSKSELIEKHIGAPASSADFNTYWELIPGKYTAAYDVGNPDDPFANQGVLIKTDALVDDSVSYDYKIKLKPSYGIDTIPDTEFKLEFTLGLPFDNSIRDSGDFQLDVFISGSSVTRDIIENKDAVKLINDASEGIRISSLTKKSPGSSATYTYYFKSTSPGKLFPIFVFNNAVFASIKNISIKPRNEFGYSPNQAKLFVPTETLKQNTELVFNIEYLNKKKERSKVNSQVYGLVFTGSGITPGIVDNGLSGSSMFIGVSQSVSIQTTGSSLYSTNPSTSNFSLTDGIFLGQFAGNQSPNADNSVFIGRASGQQATNATYSNFIGFGSGYFATGAAYSNFIGNAAGWLANSATGSNFIGSRAGYFSVSSSYSNYIGHRAGSAPTVQLTPGRGNIVIGTNITVPANANDKINIGGLIFASGSHSPFNPLTAGLFSGSANGKIGINQPNPQYSFDVSGSGNFTNNLYVTGGVSITGSLDVSGSGNFTDNLYVTGGISISGSLDFPDFVFVTKKEDLPTPSGGVITLEDKYTYYFTTTVDLTGDRIVAGQDTTILGSSSENCRIKSTGLSGSALISSQHSLPMRGITIEANIALDLNASGSSSAAIDWFGVNFTDCDTVGTISNYNNFIMTDSAFLNSQGLAFSGSLGTVGFNQCFFDVAPSGTMLILPEEPEAVVINRRFRVIYSSFVVLPGETGLYVYNRAEIPVEGYILDTVNFSGGGTYLNGVDFLDNRSLYVNCVGITNTAAICNYYMQNNATVTDITASGAPVRISGATTANAINQKFTHTDNRATYIGAISRVFKITVTCTIEAAGSGKTIGLYLAKNGVLLTDSEIYATTDGNNRAENISIQSITQLFEDDYIEVWIENDTDATDVTVTFLNVIATTIN